jgi:hypothetical protein
MVNQNNAVQNAPTPINEQEPKFNIIKSSISTILNRLDMQTKAIADLTGTSSAEIRAIKRQSSAISFERALTMAVKLNQTTAFLQLVLSSSAKAHQSITGEKMKPVKIKQKELF